jgi:hypothetical protein
MPAKPAPTAREPEAVTYLDALAAELTARGMRAVVTTAAPTPAVLVTNPRAAVLNERVIAAPDGNGTWWFWWPWAERIAPAAVTADAAGVIISVLRTGDDGQQAGRP